MFKARFMLELRRSLQVTEEIQVQVWGVLAKPKARSRSASPSAPSSSSGTGLLGEGSLGFQEFWGFGLWLCHECSLVCEAHPGPSQRGKAAQRK